MYNLLFFILHRIFSKNNDDDPGFTAVLAVFIIGLLHILAIWKVLACYGLIVEIPRFSDTYTYNKLYWSIVLVPFSLIVILYFSKDEGSL